MNLTKAITQKELDKIFFNDADKQGNKIKLRSVSLANLLDHVQSIPVRKTIMEKITVVQAAATEFISGQGKALNAKEQMVKNISKKAPKEVLSKKMETSTKVEKEKVEAVEKKEEKKISEPVKEKEEIKKEIKEVADDNKEKTEIKEPKEEVKKEEIKKEEPEKAKTETKEKKADKEENKGNSFDEFVTEIKTVTESVQEIKARAEEAEAEASNSTEALNQLGIEETEVAKSLEAAKARKIELEKAVIAAYNNQKNTLIENRKKYEDIIADANKRKEENQNKIAKFQTKIEKDKQVLSETENEIAKLQEIYNAVNFEGAAIIGNNNAMVYDSPEEEAVKTMRTL